MCTGSIKKQQSSWIIDAALISSTFTSQTTTVDVFTAQGRQAVIYTKLWWQQRSTAKPHKKRRHNKTITRMLVFALKKKLRIDLVNVPASNWIMIEKVKGKQESLSFCVNHHDRGAERLKWSLVAEMNFRVNLFSCIIFKEIFNGQSNVIVSFWICLGYAKLVQNSLF